MIVIDNEFEIGQIVYLKTDADQSPRIVTGIKYCKAGELVYELSCGIQSSNHYGFEIQAEKDHTVNS